MSGAPRTILRRFFERVFPYVPRFPVLAIGFEGDVPLESSGRGAPDQDWPIGSRWTQIDAAAAGDILWVKRAAGLDGWAKLGTILNEAQDDAIAAAQAAADAAQGDVNTLRTEYDAQAALLGDLTDIVGPSAPPGSADTVVEGFQSIITQLNALNSVQFQSMASDAASTDATNGRDTGLGMTCEAGQTYAFEWWMFTTTSASTIGARWSVRSADAAGTLAVMSNSVIASGNQSGYALALNNWTAEPDGPGSEKILVRVSALFKCTKPGTVHLYIRPEGGTATAHAGSMFMYRKVTSA